MHYIFILLALFVILPASAQKNEGELSNLVCFVRFADETEGNEFEKPFSDYEQLFNDSSESANSVFNYFQEVSYGKLSWTSAFYPANQEGKVIAYTAKNERGYYQEKSSINEEGYTDEVDRAAREQALIKEIAAHLSENLPDNVVLDANTDGIIDNVTLVLSGRSELSNRHLLWPHRSDLALPDEKAIYIKGKKLVGYLLVFDDANGWKSLSPIPLNTGVLCHEMAHSLGTYDLYHTSGDLNPVGVWDLMSDNLLIPQHMSAYTKYRYCKWLTDIPEITEPGTYTLNPVGGNTPENIAYKIKPVDSEEYFVVEYRRQAGTFEAGLPASGLLVYRINPAYTGGNAAYNGSSRLDEVYIFRPGGSPSADGNLNQAAFSQESGRTAFGGTADVRPFYSDGTEARFALTNISSCGETISFTFETLGHQIVLSEETITFQGTSEEKCEITLNADVDWNIADIPEWLSLSPTLGNAGKTVLTLETNTENSTYQTREAVLSFVSQSDPSVRSVLNVRQLSNLILPPTDVKAELEENTVRLTWASSQEGAPLLFDGFEDTSNPNGWQIKNEGDRGWHWYPTDKYYPAHTGSYSFYMKSAWEDLHQDERLTSPSFANGHTLTFYSRSIAPQKNVADQFYYVEVSKDNGATWTAVYDLIKDCDVVNKFTKITIDLSAYQSPTMKIAFHAYDTNNVGLSYWWQIDDVRIDGVSANPLVTAYAIYRDGERIGEASECCFVDESPLKGEHTYTVRALGTFGESSDSEGVKVSTDPTSIPTVSDAENARISLADGMLHIRSASPFTVRVFDANGALLLSRRSPDLGCELDATNWLGVFIVKVLPDSAPPIIRKFVR